VKRTRAATALGFYVALSAVYPAAGRAYTFTVAAYTISAHRPDNVARGTGVHIATLSNVTALELDLVRGSE
jgi:hypothetical protein